MNSQNVVPMATPAEAAGVRQPQATRRAAPAHSPFVPVLLGSGALLLGLGWQAQLLLAERSTLQAAHTSQQQTVDNAGTLRASLDTLAANTQRLADSGNASAGLLVAELRQRGITINAQAGAGAPAMGPAAKP